MTTVFFFTYIQPEGDITDLLDYCNKAKASTETSPSYFLKGIILVARDNSSFAIPIKSIAIPLERK